jgi:hypothetical protein
MTLGVWLCVVVMASACFGSAVPGLAGRMAPGPATWLLSVGSLVLAASTVVLPALIAVTALGQLPAVAAIGQWSPERLADSAPIGTAAAVGVAFVSVGQLAVVVRAAWRQGRRLLTAWRAARSVPASLVVIPDENPTAFAVPGWPGRIVASTGLLQSLNAAGRQAVLAHEQAHLDRRHDLHLAAGALAVAANPLLKRVPGALRLATERAADETAAAMVGDRRLVAATIGWAATAGNRLTATELAILRVAGSDVTARVGALTRGSPRRRPVLEGLVAALIVAAAGSALLGMADTKHMFEMAERAYMATPNGTS